MEKRKVQKTGGSTYTVSLPKEWAEDCLDFGDYLSIEKNENYLKLFSEREEEENKRASIKFDEETQTLFRKTVSLYLSGYDHINVVSRVDIDTKDLEKMVKRNMVGMEVVKSGDSRIELKNLVRYEDLPFQQVLVRIDSLLKGIMDKITAAMEKEKGEIMDQVEEKEQEVDRMYMLGVRQLKHAATDPETLEKLEIDSKSECVSLRVVLKSLERMGDHLKKIGEEVEKVEEVPENYRLYLEDVESCYRTAMNALRKKDPGRAESAIQKARSTPDVPEEDLEKEEYLTYREMENSIERIKLLSDDIAEVVMNITIEERDEKDFFE
jgi:phosphate uptake regulator